MSTEPQTWPFDSPPNVACFTVRSIVDGVKPVLMASRDADDGAWQFLTGDAFNKAEAMLVSFEKHGCAGLDPAPARRPPARLDGLAGEA